MSKQSILRFGLILATALVLLAGLITFGIYLARPQAVATPEALGQAGDGGTDRVHGGIDASHGIAYSGAPPDPGLFRDGRAPRSARARQPIFMP
jgi:hypothetical protein